MGNWFGRKKSRITQHDKAVLDLKVQRDKLKQYQKKINDVIERETEIARVLLKEGKKEKAMLALKKKKYQQQLLDKTEGQLNNIQEMIDSIDFAQIEKKVFDGLQQGTAALKEIQKELSIEAVEKLMEESQEAIEYQQEVSRILSERLGSADEDDALRDLEALEAAMMKEELPSIPKHDVGPTATKETKSVEEDEIVVEQEQEEAEAPKRVAVMG
eukprot:GEZU01002483.1.p1 GENE.GEZU01002483.1~~GEZU01002483.1.p1  ORF type:complete len:215 (-),score=78.20 GEZU01002483.1:370-1014(-)